MGAALSYKTEELSALIAAAQDGDEAALRGLVLRYQSYLLRLARRRIRATASQRPSDLVQDTLERAVRCLRRFQGQTDPELRRWLAVILQNVFVQQLRASRRKRRAAELVPLTDSEQPAEPDAAPSPSQVLYGREAWRALLRAVFELPEAQRDVVHRYLRGEPVADIARALERTPAAVSCLLQRAGKALQQKLGEHGRLGPWFQTMRRLLCEAG